MNTQTETKTVNIFYGGTSYVFDYSQLDIGDSTPDNLVLRSIEYQLGLQNGKLSSFTVDDVVGGKTVRPTATFA